MSPRLPVLVLLALAAACGPGGGPLDPSADSDGDGILDVHEGTDDPDGDGLANLHDPDSDGDGFPDAVERGDDDPLTLPFDTDGDRTPDFLDLDSDGNGLPDAQERYRGQPRPDPDGDGLLDPHDLDDDGDGVPDVLEGAAAGLDSDQDGDPDRVDTDSDDDGIEDALEGLPIRGGVLYDHDQDGTPDLRDLDSDSDGLTDAQERGEGPEPQDTDGDGGWNARDRDSDNDGLADDEDTRLADPLHIDTDGDDVRDGVEVQLGSDPRDPESVPVHPQYVVRPRIDVEESRTLEVEVGKPLVDLTLQVNGQDLLIDCQRDDDPCWTWSQAIIDTFDAILPDLQRRHPDLHVGVALTFTHDFFGDDRSWSHRGAFEPIAPVQASWSGGRAALQAWQREFTDRSLWYLVDGQFLAVDQLLRGTGYDAECDGRYDPARDVLPWVASPDDPFSGRAGDHQSALGPGGGLPGIGRRPFAMPIILLGLRQHGTTDPGGPLDTVHSEDLDGCPGEVTSSQTASRLAALGGRLVVLDLVGFARFSTIADEHYRDIADVFDSYGDLDGDGERDDPLILSGAWGDTGLAIERVAPDLNRIIDAAIASRDFSRVEFAVTGDEHGLVTSFDPPGVDLSDEGSAAVEVTLTFRGVVPPAPTDQVFELDLVAAGDGVVSLGSQPFYVVVPGTGLD